MSEANQYLRLPGHNLNLHVKFTLIEQLNNTMLNNEQLTFKKRTTKTIGLHKPKKFHSNVFNVKLNFPNS